MIGMNLASLNWHNISTDETSVVHSDLEELRACVRRAETLQAQQPLPEGALEAEMARMLTITRGQAFQEAGPKDLADLAHDIALLHQPPVTRQTDALLVAMAQIVVRADADNALPGWRPFDLTLMIEALSVSRSREARRALKCLAQQIGEQDLTNEDAWSSRSLARIALTFGTSGLTGIRPAMRHLARSLSRRSAGGECWSPELLTLFASAFGRARGEEERELFSCMAAQVMNMVDRQAMTNEDGWTAQHLAMVIAGLANGRGVDVRRAQVHMALEIAARPLTVEEGWSLQNLAMAAQGLQKSGDPDFRGVLALLAMEIGERLRTGEETLSRETLLLIEQAFPGLVEQCA